MLRIEEEPYGMRIDWGIFTVSLFIVIIKINGIACAMLILLSVIKNQTPLLKII